MRVVWTCRRLEALSRSTNVTKSTRPCSPGLACSAWGGVGTIVVSDFRWGVRQADLAYSDLVDGLTYT